MKTSIFFPRLAGMAMTLTLLATTTFGQGPDVLDIAGERVSLTDFEHVFGKNNRDSVYTVEALDEYMELFINFKLNCLLYTSPSPRDPE